MVSSIICVILFLLFLPLIMGVSLRGFENGQLNKDRQTTLSLVYIEGLVCVMALFEIVCLIGIFAPLTMHIVAFSWIGLVILLCLISLFFYKKELIEVCADIKSNLIKLNYDKMILFIQIVVVLGILCMLIIKKHYDADDAWYVGTALTSLETNTIYKVWPFTGEIMDAALFKNYIVSPYPVFFAVLSFFFRVHPAIIMHSIMPAMSYIWFALTMSVIGQCLFKSKRLQQVFFLMCNVFLLFGSFSTRTMSSYLLWRSWQGKAVLVAIVIPLIWYSWLQIRMQCSYVSWIFCIQTVLFGWLLSGNMTMIAPILFLLFGGDVIINRLGWKNLIGLGVCMGISIMMSIPNVLW